jgi:hypothetical protein
MFYCFYPKSLYNLALESLLKQATLEKPVDLSLLSSDIKRIFGRQIKCFCSVAAPTPLLPPSINAKPVTGGR